MMIIFCGTPEGHSLLKGGHSLQGRTFRGQSAPKVGQFGKYDLGGEVCMSWASFFNIHLLVVIQPLHSLEFLRNAGLKHGCLALCGCSTDYLSAEQLQLSWSLEAIRRNHSS